MIRLPTNRTIAKELVAVISLLSLLGCGSAQALPAEESQAVASKDTSSEGTAQYDPEDVTEGEELLCLVESEEEARRIAELYGIEFVEYYLGVATFHTDEDLQKVIALGKEKGYPELSINGTSKLY